MSYIKKAIIFTSFLLLFSCALTDEQEQEENNAKTEPVAIQSINSELILYKNAIIALNNNERDKAELLFTKMSVLQPDFAGSWANLGLISIQKGDLQVAKKHVQTALSKNPKMPQSWNLSGYLALQNGNIQVAEKYYKKAISISPTYALAHYNLALLYDIYFQDIEKAVHHYQQYLSNIEAKDKETEDWLDGLKATLEANT